MVLNIVFLSKDPKFGIFFLQMRKNKINSYLLFSKAKLIENDIFKNFYVCVITEINEME